MMDALAAMLLVTVFGLLGYRWRWLTAAGSVLAGLFGFCLLWLGGAPWAVPVLVFFGTSSALSRLGLEDTGRRRDDIRNGRQVMANGGVAWALLLAHALGPDPALYAGFTGALAAATADTWATEIGRVFGGMPRSITTGKPVPRGSSGGVTLAGTLAAFAGALLLGIVAFSFVDESGIGWVAVMTAAGVAGCFLDSLIGATLQARYRDETTGAVSESAGGPLVHGWAWITNDTVNVFCTLGGALAGMGGWIFLEG